MGDYRSNSYGNGGLQIQRYYEARTTTANPQEFRSYSAASSYTSTYTAPSIENKEMKFKKAKSHGSSSKASIFSDPEFQRKKRVASYKIYSVEGKVKGTFRKSFSWLKDRFYAWL